MMNHLAQKRAHQLITELKARNLFDHCTNESKLITALVNQYYCYLGFDPTAESLHLGNYVGIIVLKLFQKYHFPVCALIGGATALIGDPSFKGQERQLLNHQLVVNNSQEIEKQISNILGTKALVVNNINFYQTMGVLGFLREVGKLVNVNHLLDKEALKTRLTTGLSYAEFSYPLLQGWDFIQLWKTYQVAIQIGGSDQWGNITNGIQMAHKIYGQNQIVVGLTFPLLTDQHGKKFGKSENNALFLNPKLTHPYVIYQFLVQTNDADLAKYFRSLTLLDLTVIQGIITQTSHDRKKVSGQVVLAWQVVSDLYGKKVADHCLTLAYKLFYASWQQLTKEDFQALKQVLKTVITKEKITINEALLATKLVSSATEGKKLIKSQAISFFGQLITNNQQEITINDQLFGYVLIKKGKKQFALVQFQ